jgi:hypothetical protein
MSDLDEMAAEIRTRTNRADWPEPAEIRRRGDQRTLRQRAVTIVAAVVVLAIAVPTALVLRTRPPAGPPPIGTSTTPSPTTQPLALPHVVAHGSLRSAREPESVAVGANSVWIALRANPIAHTGDQPGPGELVRLDARTLARQASWPVVGSPIAIAVSQHYVWVAGDIFDGRPPAQGANHVQQFDLAGHLMHTYDITNPSALAVQGDAAWVEYQYPGNAVASVARLHDGVTDPPVRLGGANVLSRQILVACGEWLYAVSQSDTATFIDRISADQSGGRVELPDGGSTQLGCDGGSDVLAVTTVVDQGSGGPSIQWPGFGTGPRRPAVALPNFTLFFGSTGPMLWLAHQQSDTSFLGSATDLSTLATSGGIRVPDQGVSVVIGQTLWTVAPDTTQSGTWIVTAVDP